MAADPIDRIVAMLAGPVPEKRLAAATVLRELGLRAPAVVHGLADSLAEGGAPLQLVALGALAAIGAKKAVPQILPLVSARDERVREAAVDALAAVGDEVVPLIEARLKIASAEERRSLDEVLARVGGKDAFSALLAGLETADEEQANAAAVAMRQRVRAADNKTKGGYLTQLVKLLAPRAGKTAPLSVPATKAALKMLGYLEDERATEILLDYASKKRAPALRQEALIALRFAQKESKPDAKVLSLLVDAALEEDRSLAQAALITLSGLPLPARAAQKLAPLLEHPDLERARFAIEFLAHRDSDDAVEQLVLVVTQHEPRRAELAARALTGKKAAAPLLVEALVKESDLSRTRMFARILDTMKKDLAPALREKLLELAMKRLEQNADSWQSLFDVAHGADPVLAGNALRALHARLKKRGKLDEAMRVLRQLCRTDQAAPADRFTLALALAVDSPKDTSPSARQADEALGVLGRLARERFDVAGAMLADKELDLETAYYVGFHFIEQGNPAGDDLLRAVNERAGRKKIGAMAKNKLALAERG